MGCGCVGLTSPAPPLQGGESPDSLPFVQGELLDRDTLCSYSMCGITGSAWCDPDLRIEADVLDRMTDVLAHRGPDGRGTYRDETASGGAALGHRRLSIIDLATGKQPMSNEDETVWITFNGEIYNYRELRTDLANRGHQFRTDSDTETIVHLYEELGDACLERLRGMFAFAIWDRRQQRLFMARDRMGQKPLVYRRGARPIAVCQRDQIAAAGARRAP